MTANLTRGQSLGRKIRPQFDPGSVQNGKKPTKKEEEEEEKEVN